MVLELKVFRAHFCGMWKVLEIILDELDFLDKWINLVPVLLIFNFLDVLFADWVFFILVICSCSKMLVHLFNIIFKSLDEFETLQELEVFLLHSVLCGFHSFH